MAPPSPGAGTPRSAARSPSPSPGAGAPRSAARSPSVPTDTKRDAQLESSRSVKIQLNQSQDADSPIPQLSLHKLRFLLLVLVGVGLVAAGLTSLRNGRTIETDVSDLVGTSTNAGVRVELYQAINGFVWAAIGLLLEEYFKIFIAVMLIFFANLKWSPNEIVTDGPSKTKLAALFWFTPLIMYIINIGLSSVFIEHRLEYTARGFADEDLVNPTSKVVTAAALSSDDGRTSVRDTVLRSAVDGGVLPFLLDPDVKCAIANVTEAVATNDDNYREVTLPKITDLQGTSAAFGFTPRYWNLDAMPYSIPSKASVKLVNGGDAAANEAAFATFMKESGLSYETLIDLMIQGHTLHGKALSDTNAFELYNCSLNADGTPTEQGLKMKMRPELGPRSAARTANHKRNRRLQSSSNSSSATNATTSPSSKATGTCFGVGDIIHHIKRLPIPADHTAAKLLAAITDDLSGIMAANATLEIDVVTISPLIQVTMITIDLPLEDNQLYMTPLVEYCTDEYKFTKKYAAEVKNLTKAEYAEHEEYMCSPNVMPYDMPFQQCGESSCVVEDLTDAYFVNRQVSMVPFMTQCDPAKRYYDPNTLAWMPKGCTAQPNSMFLYSAGSYFTGNLEKRGDDEGPLITNPRRHHKLTFAKLDWKYEDLAARFNAKCDVEDGVGCSGLIHALENVRDENSPPRVLIVSEKRVPTTHINRTLQNPLALVMLRDPKFYGLSDDGTVYTAYEYMDIKLMNTTYTEEQTLGLSEGNCSLYVDAYLKQVENNRYYIQDPRQVVYTSALFYLFQDAAVKEVTPTDKSAKVVDLSQPVIGSARMQGDLEIKEIRYSIPLLSVISTAIGIVMVLIFMGIIIKWPLDAVKKTIETNAAAQYADMLIDDLYPEKIHTRRLLLEDGSEVEMDDYATKRIVFRNLNAPDTPVVME